MHQHGLQGIRIARLQQRHDLGQQLLRHHGHAGTAVLQVVADFALRAHGVDRHHHGPSAHDAVVGRHVLRAVLAHQQDPVAALHTQPLSEVTGQRLHTREQRHVAQRAAAKNHGRLVRKALGRDLNVMRERHLRQAQRARNPFGPIRQRRCGHEQLFRQVRCGGHKGLITDCARSALS